MGKIKIGIDGRKLGHAVRDGIANYVKNLSLRLFQNHEVEWFVFSPYHELSDEIEKIGGFTHICPKISFRYGGWFYCQFPLALRNHPVDVLWEPTQLLPWIIPSKIKTVLTIHDFTFLKFPETMTIRCRMNLKAMSFRSYKRADFFTPVSQTTANDLIKLIGDPSKVKVVYTAMDPQLFYPDPSAESLWRFSKLAPRSYFLTVGSIEPRKNLRVVLEAYEELYTETNGSCPTWSVVYSNTWKSGDLLERMQKGPAASGIRLFPNLPNDDLRVLYSNAIVLLYPSLYEGFGLPQIEAMACGCPVIASDIPICREVCGDAGTYVSPSDGRDFISKMLEFAINPPMELIKNGLERAAQFTWERAACELFEVFMEAAQLKKR